MKVKNIIQGYLSEEYLYVIYKLINIKKFANKELIDFEYLKPPKKPASSVWFILNTLILEHGLDIKIKGLVFHKDLYKKYNPDDYQKVVEQLEKDNKNSTLKRIFNNTLDCADLQNFPFTQSSIHEWIEFNSNIPQETIDELTHFLKKYLSNYIAEKLFIDKENITIFSKQKDSFFYELKRLKQEYGNTLVLSYNDFLFSDMFFMHNLLAFDQLKYLTINELYILNYEQDPVKQEEKYNANITLLPKYITEDEAGLKEVLFGTNDETKIKQILKEIEENNIDINVIISNLERRFQALLENRKQDNFNWLFLDYINYLGRTKIISKIIEKLAMENKISKDNFMDLCISYIASSIGQETLHFPLFITNQTNNKYDMKKELTDFFENEKKEVEEARKKGIKFFDPENLINTIDDDLFIARKLYNDIMEELTNFKNRDDVKQVISKTTYKDGILTFKNTKFDLSRKQNQKDLLNTLFKNSVKNWYYDEIQEDWDKFGELEQNYWRKFYTAGEEINKLIAIELGIKDFIIKSTKQIRINSKYI